jgi:hypothetical protein
VGVWGLNPRGGVLNQIIMKSKQAILNEVFSGCSNSYASDLYLKAMDQWATEMAVQYCHSVLVKMGLIKPGSPHKEAYEVYDKWVNDGFNFL